MSMVSPDSQTPRLSTFRSQWHLLWRTEARLLTLLLGILALIWGFLALTDEVREGDTRRFDRTLLLAFRTPHDLANPIGPRWLEESARDVTALGGFTTLTLVTATAFVVLRLLGRRTQAWILAGVVVFAQVFAETVKSIVHRSRPELVPHHDMVYSSSFPSGHAMMAPVVYLTLAVIVSAGHRRTAIKSFLLIAAAVLVAGIGISRVYLGVHWPSDVLAGWTLGVIIALVASELAYRTAPKQNGGFEIQPDPPDMSRSKVRN